MKTNLFIPFYYQILLQLLTTVSNFDKTMLENYTKKFTYAYKITDLILTFLF